MLLEVIEAVKELMQNTNYASYSYLAIQAGHTPSQKTVNARKEGMYKGKSIFSHLKGKAVNNYSQFWK